MVSEGAGAAAGYVSSPPEFDHRSCSTYTVVASEEVGTCW